MDESPPPRRRSRSGPIDEEEPELKKLTPVKSDRNNWLVCASCSAPVLHRSELVTEEVESLKDACYAYQLDVLDSEVTVYSATNTADHRFDVVRAILDGSIQVPPVPQQNRLDERDAIRSLLNHLRGFSQIGLVNLPPPSTDSETQVSPPLDPQSVLADIERFIDETTPESKTIESTPSSPRTPPVIARRIQTTLDEPTEEYSWFPGFSWTIAACNTCREHMGWVFWVKEEEGWNEKFVSLIVTRLRENHISSS